MGFTYNVREICKIAKYTALFCYCIRFYLSLFRPFRSCDWKACGYLFPESKRLSKFASNLLIKVLDLYILVAIYSWKTHFECKMWDNTTIRIFHRRNGSWILCYSNSFSVSTPIYNTFSESFLSLEILVLPVYIHRLECLAMTLLSRIQFTFPDHDLNIWSLLLLSLSCYDQFFCYLDRNILVTDVCQESFWAELPEKFWNFLKQWFNNLGDVNNANRYLENHSVRRRQFSR